MLCRRHFPAASAAVTVIAATRVAAQDRKVLQVCIDGDTNISGW